MKHELWLWFWFSIGMATYWLKRAYFLISGPNPVANTYKQFIERCWAPLIVRAFIDSMFFWFLFTPGIADKVLNMLGWANYAWVVQAVTQFGPFAAAFGHTVDSFVDIAVTKIPFLKDILPQMPGPLPQQAPPDPDKK